MLPDAKIEIVDSLSASMGVGWPVVMAARAAAKGADALALVTKHAQYRDLDFTALRKIMKTAVTIDGRNIVDQESAERAGFVCRVLGRGK